MYNFRNLLTMKYAIIHNDEVINVINWDGITPFQYPFEHDEMIQSDELQQASWTQASKKSKLKSPYAKGFLS